MIAHQISLSKSPMKGFIAQFEPDFQPVWVYGKDTGAAHWL